MSDAKSQSGKPSARLLRWYDRCARDLPWRTGPAARKKGVRPDPYAGWLSEIMLQQTTVATVTPRFAEFLARWPTVDQLAATPLDEVLGQWAGLGYYARARNLHKCAVSVVTEFDGVFPQTEKELLNLPGVGAYTAAAIAAIAFDGRAIVVDGNIERVVSRYCAVETPLPASKPEIRRKAEALWPSKRSGDFAQALMDLGATICMPRNPRCADCPLQSDCAAFRRGIVSDLPRKAKKKAKPTRYGSAYVFTNQYGEVLFERRPENGLLGGMLGLPGTDWSEEKTEGRPPADRTWRRAGVITHTFTHFHLQLAVHCAESDHRPKSGERWIAPNEAKLPTVMKKALELALEHQGDQQCLFD